MTRFITLMTVFLLVGCRSGKTPDIQAGEVPADAGINLTHALSLVDSVQIRDAMVQYISIYADAPDYSPVIAKGEGITCVDDVGRFLEVLEFEINRSGREELVPLAEGMVLFLMFMSRPDGLWYNFMFPDGTINTDHVNSRAQFGWWAVRGLRGLTAGFKIFENRDFDAAVRIHQRMRAAAPHLAMLNHLLKSGETENDIPHETIRYGPDLGSELLLVLTDWLQFDGLEYPGMTRLEFPETVRLISENIMRRQISDPNHDLCGMYFCWQDIWHNWGNNQVLALVRAWQATGNDEYLKSAQLWADHFLNYLIENRFPRRIVVHEKDYIVEQTPQIAYGQNSLYRGISALAEVTRDEKYRKQAESVFQWFTGDNIAEAVMYDIKSGRGYDGINAPEDVNRNSGAESTIESLLAFQARSMAD